MTREEALKVLLNEWKCIDRNDGVNCDRKCESCDLVMDSFVLKDAYNTAIKALEQAPCEDAISRQAVQDYIAKYLSQYLYNDVREAVEVIDEYIGELPSVNPQSKTGYWIGIDEEPHEDYKCSCCGYVVSTFTANIEPHTEYKYCPHCGERME